MMVVTNLNKFVVVLYGMLFLSEAATATSMLGCLITIGGGAWYAKAREQAAEEELVTMDIAQSGGSFAESSSSQMNLMNPDLFNP